MYNGKAMKELASSTSISDMDVSMLSSRSK